MKPKSFSASQIIGIALLQRKYGYTDAQVMKLLRRADAPQAR